MTSETELAGWRASAEMHQGYMTGMLIRAAAFKGADASTELNFRTFRTQHNEKFKAGIKSLGLDGLPHAVACAQYIYLANHVGGVKCEFIPENDKKAWVRYLPPRWVWEGAAICAVPNETSIAFMRGFHAQCGVTLGNPRLGFVCTKITTRCDPCLEGYFIEEDRPLGEGERLRFRFDEDGPDPDPAKLPTVDWTEERMVKARRNYAVQYIRTMLPAAVSLFGEAEMLELTHEAAVLIGMQTYDPTAETLGVTGKDAACFADYLAAMLEAGGDPVERTQDGDATILRTKSWRMMEGKDGVAPACFDAWNGLWQGAKAAHNWRLTLDVTRRMDKGDNCFEWRIAS